MPERALGPLIPPGRYVKLPGRGTTFLWEAEGAKGVRTLLLLHGWHVTAAVNWYACMRLLGRRFRVVAFDQRGHGRGIRSRRTFSLEDCADDAVAVADHLGIETVIPVGYSLGGAVAQLVWRRHPERVEGLVLCATSRNFRGSDLEKLAYSAVPSVAAVMRFLPPVVRRELFGVAFRAPHADHPQARRWVLDEVRRNDPAVAMDAARAVGRFTSHEWIGTVDVPTGVVVTLHDRIVPPHRQLKLAKAIPGATVHPVDGDHTVCVERPDLFVFVLADACESVVRRTRALT